MPLNIRMKSIASLILIISLFLFSSCAIPIEDRAPLRQKINDNGDEVIAALVKDQPELQKSIDDSVGYFTGRVSSVKIPVVGAGNGLGVLYDKENSSRTYMNIKRFDLGLGLATGTYRLLTLFEDQESLEKFRAGFWKSGLAAQSGGGEMKTGTIYKSGMDEPVYLISEGGAALTAGARLVRLSVNEDLTDTGVSEVGIPNTRLKSADQQGKDAPRIWERKLPFLAQKVVDLGYDLPLPYGIGITYANVSQSLLLSGLKVGFNGGGKEDFDFVSFENGRANNDTVQLKLDAWLFPFMNVFAMLGRVDGKAPLDVILDGNGMLDQLGISCSGPAPNPLCAKLKDQTITLPIEAPYSGNTYGVGTVLAGGWNNWFVAIPMSFTYADMDTTDTEGISITITPRVGRILNLSKWGNLSLFGGGNYFDTELTITGSIGIEGLTIDYTVEQKNEDKWNLLIGGNWDINERWSWSAEYNGFIGSRDAFITSFGFRF
jgi:hypothetical protein